MNIAQSSDITIQQIRIFVACAENKSFSVAAEKLFLTQPTVSKWIAKLERQLDCKLFLRGANGVILTKQGEMLLAKWQPMLLYFNESLDAVKAAGNSAEAIRIGCLTHLRYEGIITDALSRFSNVHPETQIILEAYEFKELRENLHGHRLDAAFTYSFDFAWDDSVRLLPLSKAELYLVGTARTMEDSASEGYHTLLLLSKEESQFGCELVMAACRGMGYDFERVYYYPNLASLEIAVRQGKGVMICGDYIFQKNDHLLRFPVPKEIITNFISLVWLEDIKKPQALLLTEALSEIYR